MGGFFSAGAAATGSALIVIFFSSFKGPADDTSDLGFLLAFAGADLGLPSKFSGFSQGLDVLEELRVCTFTSSSLYKCYPSSLDELESTLDSSSLIISCAAYSQVSDDLGAVGWRLVINWTAVFFFL